jgi:Ca2+-binding RTX toxin-like protein
MAPCQTIVSRRLIDQSWSRSLALGVLTSALGCGQPESIEPSRLPLLAADCAIDPSGNLTLTVAGGETATLARRVSDGKVVANAALAGGVCTVPDGKRITINGDAGDNKVIIDYANGVFGAGTSSGPGIVIALGGEVVGDSVKVRGSAGADRYTFGTAGAAIDSDPLPDLGFSGVEDLVVSTGAGDDVVTGAGGQGTGGPCPIDLTVYGGEGDDTLEGGAGHDTLDCGAGGADKVTEAASDDVTGCER